MTATRVLVLDGGTTQALACVRALGRAGHTVFVAGVGRHSLAAWSRHCSGRYRLADETLPAFAALRGWAREQGVQVVLPQTERSCTLCNLQRKEWEAVDMTVGCGPEDQLLRAFDKALTWELAEACGVRLPSRHVPTTLADGHAAAKAIGYPVVVKPRFSHLWDGARFISGTGSRYARNRAELEASMRACQQGGYWPVIQEFVAGRGKGVFALCDHGTPLAWFAHERLRDQRPSGSGSSLRRSIPLDTRLLGPAARLLSAWGWHGPAMVEFRDDGASEPCLIEVNGRFWGSLELAVASGIDFPNLWLRMLRGEHPAPAASYAAGVTRRWWWGDAKRLLHILKGPPPGYPERFPGLLEGLREILGSQPAGTRSETWSKDDPWPALGEWVQGIGGLVGLVGGIRRRARSKAVAARDTTSSMGRDAPVRVLMITSGWPQPGQPQTTHFIKRQAEFLRTAGVDVDVLHFRGARRPWNYALGWLRAHRRLMFGRYDLVHAQFGQSGLLALPTRLPLVVTYRGSDLLGIVGPDGRYTFAGRLLQWLARMVARRADAVVVVSDHMKRHLPSSVRATVLPSGLDFSLFRPIPRAEARRELGLPLDRRLVLFAGNPALARKRYGLAKQAVDWLSRTLPSELVVAWGVPHTDMPRLMSACDALVFTSMQEGSPNVVKEALACDLPVVSVHVGDVAERLSGIDGCELCADEHPETIAAALARVLERGQRVAGRDAVARLDETTITARLMELYQGVLHRSPRDTHTTPATPLTHQVPYVADRPFVSVLVPCRNERPYIASCLDSILATQYPADRLEVLVVDGRSDDGTRDIVAQYAARHPAVRLLDNPQRITPVALNTGIRAAAGEIVIRMDAHVFYPPEYIPRLVAALGTTGADNVGGVLVTRPANDRPMARAIAVALSHPFGVGNSYFRIGVRAPRWVDTIAFFCCRKDLFKRIGMFDEELVRHQDGEFNGRLIKHGGRILLLPDVTSYYYARGSLAQVSRMYFQYGYFKPLVARKLGRVMSVRQMIPPGFVVSLATTALFSAWLPAAGVAFAGIAGAYAAAVLTCAGLAARQHGIRCALALAAVFPVLHVSYGFGFLRRLLGFFTLARLRAREVAELPLSR